MTGVNQTVLRGVLFFIILATMPFYALGIGMWATAPDSRNAERLTETATLQAGSGSGSATWTPLGNNRGTTTPRGFPTSFLTATSLNPMLPTPGQFLPIRTPIATAYIPPQDTAAPTLTPANDQDRDNVPDAQDACPLQAGPPQYQGCPDTDQDGIPDNRDACVGTSGTAAFNGCPAPTATAPTVIDSDGDGIPDTSDQCPSQAGTSANQGCPAPADTDGDGILDAQDACPTQAANTANGCPATPAPIDTDGDGILDTNDQCPTRRGTPLTNGCPEDNDNDGVGDDIDQCLGIPGTVANIGCP